MISNMKLFLLYNAQLRVRYKAHNTKKVDSYDTRHSTINIRYFLNILINNHTLQHVHTTKK